jgi:hypothetical protein
VSARVPIDSCPVCGRPIHLFSPKLAADVAAGIDLTGAVLKSCFRRNKTPCRYVVTADGLRPLREGEEVVVDADRRSWIADRRTA